MKRFYSLLVLMLLFCIYSFGQKVGDKVDVLWNGTYYKATVKQVKDNKWYIHYDGYESSWDEWIGKDRLKTVTKTNNSGGKTDAGGGGNTNGGNGGGKTEVKTNGTNQAWKVGDKIKVEWNGTWYPSTILQIADGKYKIHYTGWANSYDEWVTPSRMKKN